jgi:hypothetical protein
MLEAVQKTKGKTYQEITKAQTHRAVVVAEEDILRCISL